jgi:ectoine hydroxylase-related dioxygenase (phytanoyl-CoA dioxygenase family)
MRQAFAADGAFLARGLLGPDALREAKAAFDWSLDHPSAGRTADAADTAWVQDLANPAAREAYLPMLTRSPLSALLSTLWGGGPVWFFYEQIFHKPGGNRRTPWHQDTPYLPIAGRHVAVAWMSFEPVGQAEALEFCLGSHLGPVYNGSRFTIGDDTDPFFQNGDLPRLPEIEANRGAWRIKGWATEPGDVVIFHPSVLHGGGSPGAGRLRQTLSLRFFGEDAVYASRPGPTPAPRVDGLHERLEDGDPFRDPAFPRLA